MKPLMLSPLDRVIHFPYVDEMGVTNNILIGEVIAWFFHWLTTFFQSQNVYISSRIVASA
jgi:uncharacterized membrane protein YeaQ/YmgE (transglycosylase-associated protein family)